MANRRTGIGELFRRDYREARQIVLEALEATGGHAIRTAYQLGIGRRQLLRYLWRENLWPELDRIRDEHYAAKQEAEQCLKTTFEPGVQRLAVVRGLPSPSPPRSWTSIEIGKS